MTDSPSSIAPTPTALSMAEQPALPTHAFEHTRQTFTTASGDEAVFYSLQVLAEQFPNVARLPVSLRIVLESVLRHCDGRKITHAHVAQLANWQPQAERTQEIPFVVARVLLQDFTGVPLLADLAAMRSAAVRLGQDPRRIEPLVPVDLVIDHSVMVDHYGTPEALDLNMQLEFQRNRERYQFLKWGMQAFEKFGVVPPGFGIVHQVNLEYLARGVHASQPPAGPAVYYPDSLVGTDSHTTMINGLGVVAWGVGGIEAEAAMLGQPVYFLTPDVVGVELTGRLREGVSATDLVLRITEMLRKEKVVGQFVEFFGEGARTLAVPDRATLANMAPEYGATMGFFPVDEQTLDYLWGTGRSRGEIDTFEAYFRAQGLFGIPLAGQVHYSKVVGLNLRDVSPSVAGPRRPQDRIELGQVAQQFKALLSKPTTANGFGQSAAVLGTRHQLRHGEPAPAIKAPTSPPMPADAGRHETEMDGNRPTLLAAQPQALPEAQTAQPAQDITVGHGDVLIAAITSCTNTSNPSVMLAAGLLAKKAVERGLKVAPHIKTSLAPGSRMVTDYLSRAGLLPFLEQLGFALVGYGCTTCIGNSGDLTPELNEAIMEADLVCAAVLSGNRNFEARIHPHIKANFLASPPLVVAYAIAGSVLKDVQNEPLGQDAQGQDVFLRDIWPSSEEVHSLMAVAMEGERYRAAYAQVKADPGWLWGQVQGSLGHAYPWPASSYIAEPPFFEHFTLAPPPAPEAAVHGARILALFGDSITTDHISPAGAIKASSPAGQWLLAQGVVQADFNSYGSRRGQHQVMVRGTLANVRIKNLMLAPAPDGSRVEGGLTTLQLPGPRQGEQVSIFEAGQLYAQAQVPTVIFAGEEYGTGSSRDWAAKGTRLLGVRAVVARSFERIHRSNLVGMGVLPFEFLPGDSWQMLRLQGDERIDIAADAALSPQSRATLRVTRNDGTSEEVTLTLRIDTPIEVTYYQHGGILPFVLRQLLA
jgi:aconitate hydratase